MYARNVPKLFFVHFLFNYKRISNLKLIELAIILCAECCFGLTKLLVLVVMVCVCQNMIHIVL